MGLIEYKPRKETPYIRFLQNRVGASDLYIDPKAYKARKEIFVRRVETMTRYIQLQEGCRAAFIGRYFGDEDIRDCGVCDLCLNRRKQGLQPKGYQELESRAREILSRGPLTAGELLKKMQPVKSELFWELVSDWSAERWIITGRDGRIRLT